MNWSSLHGRCGMDFTRGPKDELPEPYKAWWYAFHKEREEREERERRERRERNKDFNWFEDFNGFEDFFSEEGPREFPVCEEEVSPGNPFRVLGLKRSASDEDIKTKYRELILIHHPDKGGEHHEFIRIQDAYETLKK